MKAFDLSMIMIFICVGFSVVASFGIFSSSGDFENHTTFAENLTWLYEPSWGSIPVVGPVLELIPGINALSVVQALAFLMAGGTVIFLSSNAVTAQGVSVAAFSILFWGSTATTFLIIGSFKIEGIEWFNGLFTLASTCIFIITLIQMNTGGQKAYV